jgi:hypothetical protein
MRIAILITAVTFMVGCTRTSPFPKAVNGFLVDDQLNVLDIQEGRCYSLRPLVEQQLTRNNLPKARAFSIAPNGIYFACIDYTEKIHVLDLSTGQCLNSLSLPQNCVDVGPISWKPDSSGFIFYVATAKYLPERSASDPGNIGSGFIEIAPGPGFHPHALSAVGRITNCWGTHSLARQAWCSDNCFVFGDADSVKAYDVVAGTVQTLSPGYNPMGASRQSCVFQKVPAGYADLGDVTLAISLADKRLQRLTNAALHLAVEQPVISPDGIYFIFINRTFGTTLFGLAGGFDYCLAIYDQVEDKYTKIKDLDPCAGFQFFDLDFTRPADGPLMKLIDCAVWVQPHDMKTWRSWLSSKPL